MTTTPHPFSQFAYARAIRGSDLPAIARHVALTLVTYANRTGEAWPTQATLERGTGWARRSVNNALNVLEATGWLSRVAKGYKGRATLYRLHVPGASSPGPSGTGGAPRPSSPGGTSTPASDWVDGGMGAEDADQALCTTGRDIVQQATDGAGLTCTPSPSGERSDRTPSGSALAPPEGIPLDVWEAARPLLTMLMAHLPPQHADGLADRWSLLTKARDFCWQVTALTGTNPRTVTTEARWTPAGLVEALTAVTLDGVEQPERALYRRLMNLVVGRDAVPPSEDPRKRVREVWAPPPGPVGEAIAALGQQLAMPPASRSA